MMFLVPLFEDHSATTIVLTEEDERTLQLLNAESVEQVDIHLLDLII